MFQLIKRFPYSNNWRKIAVVLLGIIFLCLLFYGFPDSPATWFDEGIHLNVAKTLANRGIFSFAADDGSYFNERYSITTGYPLLGIVALFFKVFGVGIYQAKSVMFIFLTLFVLLFYKLVKKNYGENNALYSLALLITFLPLYGNGKSILGEIPGLVYFLGGLFLLDKQKWWQIFLAGLLFGLGGATKPIYLLFIFAVFGGEVWLAIRENKINLKRWLWLGMGGILPLILWIYTLLPHGFDIASLSAIFSFYRNPYTVSLEGVMIKNLWRFFSESTPLHLTLLFAVFVAGKVLSRKFRQMEIILFIFIILILASYLRIVGWYRYFFPAHIMLFIFFPHALSVIMERLPFYACKRYGVVTIIAILLAIQSVHMAYNIDDKLYYDPRVREFAEEINQIVNKNDDVAVINNPSVSFFLQTDRVYQYLSVSPFAIIDKGLFSREYIVVDKDDPLAEASFENEYYNFLQEGRLILMKKNKLYQ